MTEPPCTACKHEAHWHRKYGPGVRGLREWNPQDGKRGRCSAFGSSVNSHGFKMPKVCSCKGYRHARERQTA
jgi:hypothetical protein